MEARDVILLVEESLEELFLLQAALDQIRVDTRIVRVPDDRTAVEYLGGTGEYGDRAEYPLPCLIVIDLAATHSRTFELLKWLLGRAEFRSTPVIVLSNSEAEEDRQRASELGASAYYLKPTDLRGIDGVIHRLAAKWIAAHCA